MEGFDEINQRFKDLMRQAKVSRTEAAVTECAIKANEYAAAMTPIATSTLINSQYRNAVVTATGVEGEFGYTAEYAGYVHGAPGTLLGTNTPRFPESDGIVWGPGGEPGFLDKGVREMMDNDFQDIIRKYYAL